MNGRESRPSGEIDGKAMPKEHGFLPAISSDRPIDETIHRGFVDAETQNPDRPVKTFGHKGTSTLVLLTRR
jgi:hypothetical protein